MSPADGAASGRIGGMLPDDLFHPLDLEFELADADESDDSGNAGFDLLSATLLDPRVDREDVSDHVPDLLDRGRDTGRIRDAIATLRVLVEQHTDLMPWLTAEIATLHLRLGERDIAGDLLARVHDEQRTRPADEQDLEFYLTAAIAAGAGIPDRDLARALIARAEQLAQQRGDSSALSLLDLRRRAERERAASALSGGGEPADHGPRRTLYRMAYLPPAEHAAAWERHLLEPTIHREHVDYRRELQVALLEVTAAHPDARAVVVPLDVAGLVTFAAAQGLHPDRRTTRLRYNDSLAGAGRDIPWPPERNAQCWCGSERKYKKCCGAPAFTATEGPDPASLTLRIELDGVTPTVWRRLAVPSNTRLDEVHRLFQSAMGWPGQDGYWFEDGDVVVVDPLADPGYPTADAERLVSLGNEVGDTFTYVYDSANRRRHTVTVEDAQPAGATNRPALLDGAGTCP